MARASPSTPPGNALFLGPASGSLATTSFRWHPRLPTWMRSTFRNCTPWRRSLLSRWFLGWCGRLLAQISPLSSAGEHIAPAHELFTKDNLAHAIPRHSTQFAVSGHISVRAKSKHRAPRSFPKMGRAQRIRLIGSPAVPPREVDRYVKDANHANLLKQVKGPLPGMASASR